jgi:Cu-Zn family superoxide dismutase
MTFHVRLASASTSLTLTLALALVVAPAAARAGPAATAALKDAAGKDVGTATFTPTSGGVAVSLKVSGLKPGKHGFHVHAVGACDAPDFKTSGGHFNPTGKKHGLASPEGHHGGDLPNLVVGADGRGEASGTLTGLSLDEGDASLFHAGGTAVVIHADEDDEKSDPGGNSGARVACGVIARGT